MDEMITDFYVTLPSNASMTYFPHNTQSSYRTKLTSPIMLSGEWEVGLAQFFAPRNWFNIDNHNNEYSIHTEMEKSVISDSTLHSITYIYDLEKNVIDNFFDLNKTIQKDLVDNSVLFIPDNDEKSVSIEISEGFELFLSKELCPDFLFMLNLPNEDITINKATRARFRPLSESRAQTFTIINKNPLNVINHTIPLNLIKSDPKKRAEKVKVFSNIVKNIEWLDLKNYVTFLYEPIKNMLEIKVSDYAELQITEVKSKSLLRILNRQGDLVIKGTQTFAVNPLIPYENGDVITLVIKEYPKITKYEKEIKKFRLNVGVYKSPEILFRQFERVSLKYLPDSKVQLEVPFAHEIHFGRGLADMLGFVENQFASGKHISKYTLELDAGISEIFVYSDLIESNYVGDTYAPLLRIIPCMNEKNDQIVKYYDTPIYFPLRKNFIDTIEIELKTVTGKTITFTGGKTFVILSFRRKKL